MKNKFFIFCNDKVGGAENVMLLIADEYIRQHKNVIIISLETKKTGRLDRFVNIDYMNGFNKWFGCFLYLIKYRKKITKDTIIFSSQIHMNGLLATSKPFFSNGAKLVVRESTEIFKRFTGAKKWLHSLSYFFYKNTNLVIAQTESMKTLIIENIQKARDWNFSAIPNPIYSNIFEQKKVAFIVDAQFTNCIVSAGRLISIKGYHILIQSYILSEKLQEYKLLIIGDGPEKQNLQNQINYANMQHQILLLGEVDNPFPYFASAKTCVVSSILEGFPNVLLEKMYCNNNVVSTTCAGDIENIKGVITCMPSNVQSLQIALEKSIQLSESELIANKINYHTELEARSIHNYCTAIDTLLV